ncbi:hypothetical protein I302_103206 [Kwoniella bestiolae CBS 10118]|uniref:Uncharacterized protein n=1 Tax=Kwoniella bestiolae CBS 10118 TaxID=1296100 RepID=A0A1B9G7W0_9TREE|nr:hypothetical protein I302_01905 [Kwoniella bestiolae CBS 10118]OCF27070.1 hypothetical protein I302_01905 [Kwoniella bestiolae CBS 10118]
MPLYKLTERRMKKKAREDEDGITRIKEAMREMGEDVDSASGSGSESEGWSESESDSDDDEEDEEEEEDDEDVEEDEEDGDLEVDMEGLESGSGSGSDGEDEEEEENDDDASSSSSVFPISLESALTQPIYPSPHNPHEQLCVLCPDKLLKNQQMINVHLDSKLHKRSLKRYSLRLTTNPPDAGADPREVVDEILAEMDSGEQVDSTKITTKRAEENNEESRKRKRSNKKERKEAKAQQLISEQKQDSSSGKVQSEKTEEGEVKLNRKARRLLALQKGEIEKKDRQK